MPINNITQTVSELPAAGKRGIDVQTIFVTKQEDFQDHLQGVTVTELNTLKDQLNTRIGEINSTATTMNGYADTASAGASTATTKAGEASTSASGALTSRNQASTFATNSSNSATKASQWADNNYNVEVETGKYSAKHWSVVAENAVESTVKLTGNQTIAGVKTFSSSPISTSTQSTAIDALTRKDYVDTKVEKVTSIDNVIVRFDGTTGKVQNSGVIIDDNNNVGIGTSNPLAKLTISNGSDENLEFFTGKSFTINGGGFQYIHRGDTSTRPDLNYYLSDGGGSHKFFTNGTERMRIHNSGNLLVGTTTDNGVDKLQVNGSISSGTIPQYTSGDLNNFKYITQTIGTYPSAFMSNTPINDHGYLEIIVYEANVYVMQRFTTLGVVQTAGRVFVRCLTNGTWSAWAEK